MKLIPTPTDVSGGDEAEDNGRKGIFYLSADENQDIEKVAKENNGSVPAFCKVITDELDQASGLVE